MDLSRKIKLTKHLEVTVWDYDRFKNNDFMGEVKLDLSGKYNFMGEVKLDLSGKYLFLSWKFIKFFTIFAIYAT